MNYYLDLEFHEHQRPVKFLGVTIKKIWTIDLISIGIACEDGREYYAINSDLDFKYIKRDKWLKENVMDKLPEKHPSTPPYGSPRQWDEARAWKPMKQIREEILSFCRPLSEKARSSGVDAVIEPIDFPEFYAYYGDYDWVRFCWIFGRMIDLPKGFPMYCRDLKQMMDDKGLTKEWKQKNCPDPEDEHNALADAKWNRTLHEKIMEA